MTTGRVYTIGHGGLTPCKLIEPLQRLGIQFVIDVRSVPYSRYQPEFSRDALEGLLARNGLKYVFMGNLLGGRPQDSECYTDGKIDYNKCRGKEFFQKGIGRIHAAFENGLRLCLMCSEGKPWECHRAKLIGEVLREQGIEVLHLLPDGTTRSQTDVLRELTHGQGDLFGERFMSRKSYTRVAL